MGERGVWLIQLGLFYTGQSGEGVKNLQNFADKIYGWSLLFSAELKPRGYYLELFLTRLEPASYVETAELSKKFPNDNR